jgi:heme/copper-type cytochrome/quinol oxidase subunit 2
MNFVLFISAMVYVCVAICVYRFMYNANENLKQRKHSERYGVEPTWVLVVISVLWPLQIVGLFIYIMKGSGCE